MAHERENASDGPGLTIAEVSAACGLSADTLRYYERAGLIARVDRTSGNQRRFAAADLAWIEFLVRLRATGMSIADMQSFAKLRAEGDATIPGRITLLRAHSEALARHVAKLQSNARVLDEKIAHFERLHGGHNAKGTP